MEYYAIPGETDQHVCKARHAPQGAVLMNEENPGGYECSTEGCADGFGVWVMSRDKLKELAGQKMWLTLEEGFLYYGSVYQCQEKDVQLFSLGLQMAQLKGELEIKAKAKDNTWHTFTIESYTALCGHIGEKWRTAWHQYQTDIGEGF